MEARRCAFALFARGERHTRYRDSLAGRLKSMVPGADIVYIDQNRAESRLPSIPDSYGGWDKSIFMRLAIPVMDEFSKYDRVVWLDADTDVTSERFAGILDVPTSVDGLAAAPDIGQNSFRNHMLRLFRRWRRATYVNSGVLVFDIGKIDKERWSERVAQGIERHLREKFRWPDQDILNGYFDVNVIDQRYNTIWSRVNDKCKPWLIHYVNSRGKDRLDKIVHERRLEKRMKTKSAFAVYADGERFTAYKENLLRSLRKFADGIDIVDLDMSQACEYLGQVPQKDRSKFARLAIPMMEQFADYEKVVWVDVDTDIVSDRFVEVVDEDTSDDGLAAVADRWQPMCMEYMKKRFPGFNKPTYFNSGVLVMDLRKIDRKSWTERICNGFDEHRKKRFANWDQDLINAYFDVRQIDTRFNGQNDGGKFPEGAFLLHYLAADGHKMLDKIVASRKASDELAASVVEDMKKSADPVDAVFVVGTGSIRGNEELRYALRNLDAHCKFVRDVYICGECPEWVDKTVVKHLRWPDRFGHAKDANIIDKLRHACEYPGIAKKILFCSDDQFQTRECSWDDFSPRYLKVYDPKDRWYHDMHRVWHSRLRKTLEREEKRRVSIGMKRGGVCYYQPHMWMQIDRDMFVDYAKWSDYEHRDDTIIASGYFNFIYANGRENFDHIWLNGRAASMPRETHVAYNDEGCDSALKLLRLAFPEKCRFEVGCSRVNGNGDMRRAHVNNDPSPASPEESKKISGAISAIRCNENLSYMLGDVSIAEELRISGVMGWRTVWNDLFSRMESPGSCMSDAAREVVASYSRNPAAMRTFRRQDRVNVQKVQNVSRRSIRTTLQRRLGNGIIL